MEKTQPDDELETSGCGCQPFAHQRPVAPPRHCTAHGLAKLVQALLDANKIHAAVGLLHYMHKVGEELRNQQTR